ncbi:MAG: pyridoxal phosphate-dependent aminotransferase [Woeseiaceae bacterium]
MSIRFNRRQVMRGVIGGAIGMATAPTVVAQWDPRRIDPNAQLGPKPGVVRLSSNENPYGPGPKALQAASDAVSKGAYYPFSIANNLQHAIADRHGLTLDNLLLSSGSNEALQAAFVAFGKKGKVVVPELTYSAPIGYASRLGVEIERVPLKADMSIDLDGMAAAVDDSVSMVYICTPNNPTGIIVDGDKLRKFCRDIGDSAIVLIDEAYNELTDDPEYSSMIDLVRDEENVLVMRTFSKIYGMAGLRIGYAMARPDLASETRKHVMSWPSGVALAAAIAAYDDTDFVDYSREMILEGRAMVNETFRRNGVKALPSQGNFIFANIGQDADEFAAKLRAERVMIRGAYQPFTNYSRVSMGKIEDLKVFDEVFTRVYQG